MCETTSDDEPGLTTRTSDNEPDCIWLCARIASGLVMCRRGEATNDFDVSWVECAGGVSGSGLYGRLAGQLGTPIQLFLSPSVSGCLRIVLIWR